MSRLSLVLALALLASSCTKIRTRPGFASSDAVASIRKAEISASSSIGGRPMAESAEFRMRLASALKTEFPSAELVESRGDIFIIFTIVDYVPGCLPNCDAPRTYRNWSCEIMSFMPSKQSSLVPSGVPFNVDGSTYNPWFDPAENCIREFAKHVRQRTA
jgi:hypothetical protein